MGHPSVLGRRWSVALRPLFAATVLGCSPASSDGAAAAGNGSADAAMGDPNLLVGTFQVRLTGPTAATPGTTSVVGKIYDGASLSEIVWEDASKDGDCKLLTPRVPFCSTPCGGGAACVENDTCKPYPIAHSAGLANMTGLEVAGDGLTFTMAPVVNNYQPPAGVTLVYPPFKEGDEVSVSTSGDYYRAFSIKATAIAPLQLTSSDIPLAANLPVKLTWTPPATADASRIRVKLDISHHGGTRGKIECDTADDGSLEVSAGLVSKLLALGVAGFPTVIVTREAKGSVTIAPGRVDLLVSSDVERAVSIAGLTSCTEDTQCATGQTCQSDLSCK